MKVLNLYLLREGFGLGALVFKLVYLMLEFPLDLLDKRLSVFVLGFLKALSDLLNAEVMLFTLFLA